MSGEVKLTKAEAQIIAWMRDGDRALYKCSFDETVYGEHVGGKFKRVATRAQVKALEAKGLIEWYACHPEDLRYMLIENRRPGDGPNGWRGQL